MIPRRTLGSPYVRRSSSLILCGPGETSSGCGVHQGRHPAPIVDDEFVVYEETIGAILARALHEGLVLASIFRNIVSRPSHRTEPGRDREERGPFVAKVHVRIDDRLGGLSREIVREEAFGLQTRFARGGIVSDEGGAIRHL